MRALRGRTHGHGDDVAQMPEEAVESRLLEVNAELTRLRSQEAELNARLRELRANKSK
jgi:ribosomal protein L29